MKATFSLVLFCAILLCSCKDDKSVESLLQTLHETMERQDSVMKMAHEKLNKKHEQWHAEYETAVGGPLDSAHIKLEQAHFALLEKHDDIIDKHEVILRMHKRLIEKYKSGKIDEGFIEEEHSLLEEEYKLMQIDHDQLLADHDKLEQDHRDFMASLKNPPAK